MAGTKTPVEVEGHTLQLSNLDKVLYPEVGFTKSQVLDYYARIAPVLLPHLRDRPLTLKRYPNGVDGHTFFEKNAPSHAPDWVRTATLPAPGSTKNRETIDYVVVDGLATLLWAANLASLELHTPMWHVETHLPDLLVADLDPGAPATAVECARVALLLRDELLAELPKGTPPPAVKTSGSKGLQVYARITDGRTSDEAAAQMKAIAERLEKAHPDLVVSRMAKNLRPGKVLVDWSQNNAAKTTVSVYSLRARPTPTVSTPLEWAEVEKAKEPTDLVFTSDDTLARVEKLGDLFAPLLHDA